MKHLTDPTFWIAIWGAATGTIATVLHWRSYRQDRANLAVDAIISRHREKAEDPLQWRFEVILRNRGRRVCYVDTVALELEVKEISFAGVPLQHVGPLLITLYDGRCGQIRLEVSGKCSLPIFPFPDEWMHGLRVASTPHGTLRVVDSLGRTLRHRFAVPLPIEEGERTRSGENRRDQES